MEEIKEKISLWEHLKKVSGTKPIVLYGMGDGADKILNACADKNIKISGVFASDRFARGNNFRGFKVKTLLETETEYDNFCILTAFATRESEVIERIYNLSEKYELYAPSFPVFGSDVPDCDFFAGNIGAMQNAYSLLCDGLSREVYMNTINFMISGKIGYLKNMETPKRDAFDLLDLKGGLYYIDAGAYDGDTIRELKNYYGNITKIAALEPDIKNFAKLENSIRDCDLAGISTLHNIGAWNEDTALCFDSKSGRHSSLNFVNPKKQKEVRVNKIDNIITDNLSGETLIKYDVEGAEREAIEGTRAIIARYSPKLIVSLYHRSEDIFKLPLYIHSLNPNYDFYIRKHKYIPCWDLNLYAKVKK